MQLTANAANLALLFCSSPNQLCCTFKSFHQTINPVSVWGWYYMIRIETYYCFSKTPSSRFSSTVKPAFLASLTEKGLVILGVFTWLISFFTGWRQSGQTSSGALSTGLRSSKPFWQTLQLLSGSSWHFEMYSYKGIKMREKEDSLYLTQKFVSQCCE